MKPQIRKPTENEIKEAAKWPIWSKEVSTFPWEYTGKETCLILEGEVTILNEKNEPFLVRSGDWVVFPKGLKCTWKITKPVKKHYSFG